MSNRIAVFPGTFDPFTNGHLDIVIKALKLFDVVIVAIGHNANKKHLFPLEKRLEWIKKIFAHEPRVKVDCYSGLTSAFCKDNNVDFIVRGLRTIYDFEYEKQIARVNEKSKEQFMQYCGLTWDLMDATNEKQKDTICKTLKI